MYVEVTHISVFQELQSSANLLVQARAGLLSGLDEQKAVADSEARERSSIHSKFRNMEHQVSGNMGDNYGGLTKLELFTENGNF